jgi:hypothetical protein
LPHQGQKIMFNLVGLVGIPKTAADIFRQTLALV